MILFQLHNSFVTEPVLLFVINTVLYADEILFNADTEDVAFLVVGDPFGFVLNYSL